MKILLVNPYIYDFTAYDLWLRPLGLLYIAAVIKKYTNCEVLWLDALDRSQAGKGKKANDIGRGKFPREIQKKPEIYKQTPRNYARYGIPLESFLDKIDKLPQVDMILSTSLMTYWIEGLQFTLKTLAHRLPRTKIVLGGIIPTLIPDNLIKKYIQADYYIRGYGETQILKLIEHQGGKVYQYPDFSHIDNIPFPAFDFLNDSTALPLLTSRGCPYHCTYCASNLLNKRFLERTPEKVLAEIFEMHGQYGTEHFVLFDDALLVNKNQRFFKVFNELKHKLKVHFHTPNGLHPGEIDRQTAEILMESGFETIRLSLESTSKKILSKSSNKVTIDHMFQAATNLEKAGYKRSDLGVYLLFGFPGQDLKDMEQALFFTRDLGLSPYLAYFSPVPGTHEFIDLQECGLLSTPVNLLETNKIYFLYNKSGLSHSEITYIKELTTSIDRRLRKDT